jgi:hypothetical protein
MLKQMCAVSGIARTLVLTPLVLAACGGSSGATIPRLVDSGLTGRVLLGPTCPVERIGHRCERPYQTSVAVYTLGPRQYIRTFRSAADGRFRVVLPAGRYRLIGTRSGPPDLRPVLVTVQLHRFTKIRIVFDTGIR